MLSELSLNESKNLTPLEVGANWVQSYVNRLGGDFSVVENDGISITLQNKSSCSGVCLGKRDQTTCHEIERTLCGAIVYFDSHLSAGFVECSNAKGDQCILRVSFNP